MIKDAYETINNFTISLTIRKKTMLNTFQLYSYFINSTKV